MLCWKRFSQILNCWRPCWRQTDWLRQNLMSYCPDQYFFKCAISSFCQCRRGTIRYCASLELSARFPHLCSIFKQRACFRKDIPVQTSEKNIFWMEVRAAAFNFRFESAVGRTWTCSSCPQCGVWLSVKVRFLWLRYGYKVYILELGSNFPILVYMFFCQARDMNHTLYSLINVNSSALSNSVEILKRSSLLSALSDK